MPNEVPDVPKSPTHNRRGEPYRPGDLILDRYMPNVAHEDREAARENLRAFAVVVVGMAKRIAQEEKERESKFESP